MDLGALLIGGGLLFASGAVLASIVASFEVNRLKAQLSKFDHDGDGKPGGSVRRAR